jgi:hypothetical protein
VFFFDSQVKDPGQTYPRALAISIILVVLTYAGPTLIGIYYIPDPEEWEDGVFVEVGEEVRVPALRGCVSCEPASATAVTTS